MRKRIYSVMMVLLFCFLTVNVVAVETEEKEHWAQNDLQELRELYALEVNGTLNEPADQDFQEKIFALLDLKKRPRAELSRLKAVSYMMDALKVKLLKDDECKAILEDFADVGRFSKNDNRTLGTARKIGLLRGRKMAEGLFLATDQPVTKAELGVFAVRYLKIKDGFK